MHSITDYNCALTLHSDDASSRIIEDAFKDETDAGKVSELPCDNVQTSDKVKDMAQHSNHPSPPSSDFEPSMDEGNPSSRIKETLTKLVGKFCYPNHVG